MEGGKAVSLMDKLVILRCNSFLTYTLVRPIFWLGPYFG